MEIYWHSVGDRSVEAVQRGGLALQQHWAYGAAIAALGGVARCAVIADGSGQVLGQAIVLFRGPLALISRGPVWAQGVDTATQGRAVRALARACRRVLIVTPEVSLPGVQLPLITGRSIAALALTSPEAMRAQMAGKWRNRLVAGEASGIAVRRNDARPDRYHWLLAAEAAQRVRRDYRDLPVEFVAAWAGVHPDGVRVFESRHNGRTIAAMLFLIHAPGASYHLGWSGPDGRAKHAHNLLMWHAMQALVAEGIHQIDLGVVETDRAPGLARFKLGAGAQVLRLGPTVWVPPLPCLFRPNATGSVGKYQPG